MNYTLLLLLLYFLCVCPVFSTFSFLIIYFCFLVFFYNHLASFSYSFSYFLFFITFLTLFLYFLSYSLLSSLSYSLLSSFSYFLYFFSYFLLSHLLSLTSLFSPDYVAPRFQFLWQLSLLPSILSRTPSSQSHFGPRMPPPAIFHHPGIVFVSRLREERGSSEIFRVGIAGHLSWLSCIY